MGAGRLKWRARLAAALCSLIIAAPGGAQPEEGVGQDVGRLLESAQTAISEERYQDAGMTLAEAMSLRPPTVEEAALAFYLMGRVSYEMGDASGAVVAWRTALATGKLPEAQRVAVEAAIEQLEAHLDEQLAGDSAAASLQQARAAMASMNPDGAVRAFEDALRLAEAAGDHETEALALMGLGSVSRGRQDWAAALPHYERAFGLAEQGKLSPATKMTVIVARAEALSLGALQGQLEIPEAERATLAALDLADESRITLVSASLLHNLGNLALARGDGAAAAGYLERAKSLGGPGAKNATALLALAAHLRGDEAAVDGYVAQLRAEAEAAGAPELAARAFESASTAAQGGLGPAGCWLDAQAADLYEEAGRALDAEELRAVSAAGGCPDTE